MAENTPQVNGGEPEPGPQPLDGPNVPSGSNTPTSHPLDGSRVSKSKRRQGQKTFSLVDMFNQHEETIGNWADAVTEVPKSTAMNASSKTSTSTVETSAMATSEITGGKSSPLSEHATHSRDAEYYGQANSLQCKVANINYKTTDEELFYFFGGEEFVLSIRSDSTHLGHRGVAFITFKSQDGLSKALSQDAVELDGRALRISSCEPRQHNPRSVHGNFRRGGYSYHNYNDGYATLPHAGRQRHLPAYQGYNASGSHQYIQHRNKDNRRYDYDTRPHRFNNNGANQFYSRHGNRSFDSYGAQQKSLYNENHGSIDHAYDNSGRNHERTRAESMRDHGVDNNEKLERRKLELQPRTKPQSIDDDMPTRPTSIFGLAKPVDTTAKEREAEERLRLEEEAFKAATAQRSRKSSSSAACAPVPLVHGNVKILAHSHDNIAQSQSQKYSPTKQESEHHDSAVKDEASFSDVSDAANTGKAQQSSVPVVTTAAPQESLADVVASKRYTNEDNAHATVPRIRNTYNQSRTFTRSRDSFQGQTANNRQNAGGKRGKPRGHRGVGSNHGTARGGAERTSVIEAEKRSAAGKEKRECIEAVKNIGRSLDNIQLHKNQGKANSIGPMRVEDESKVQHISSQPTKKEKKKQAISKEVSKVSENKQFTFSSANKFAALYETDD